MRNSTVTSQALHRTADTGALTEAFCADYAGSALGGFRKCRRLRATAPMRLGAPRVVSGDWGLGAGVRRNLGAGCADALHPNAAIIFNEGYATVQAGRGKCVAIVPHAALVALVTALPTGKKSV